MQNSRLNDIVAQLNAGKPKEAKAEADKEKQQRKKPPVKRTPKAEEDSKVKARPKSDTARAPPTTAAILAASALPGGINLDPTTAPLPKRVKDVFEFLQARNGTQFTPAQIKEAIGLNLSTDLALLREVHRHPRLTYAGAPHPSLQATPPPPTAAASWYAYLPEIPGISNKAGLLNYVRDHKGSQVQADALRQCYLGAPADLEQLKKDGLVFIVGHPDAEKETVFARDMMGQEVVLDDVRALWFEVMQEHVKDHVPRGMQELQMAVVKAGLRSALANQPIKRVAPGGPKERAKKPRQREININKATNAHLPFLFSGAQPKSLDAS